MPRFTGGVFVGVSEFKPDVGDYYDKSQMGYVGGIDLTRRSGRLAVSVEPTLGKSSGKDSTLTYFLGNVLISRAFGPGGRINPFGVLGVGYGIIDAPEAPQDNSVLKILGIGISYNIVEKIAVRAEWQYQYWKLGESTALFNPNGIQVTLLYRFGFGPPSLHHKR